MKSRTKLMPSPPIHAACHVPQVPQANILENPLLIHRHADLATDRVLSNGEKGMGKRRVDGEAFTIVCPTPAQKLV